MTVTCCLLSDLYHSVVCLCVVVPAVSYNLGVLIGIRASLCAMSSCRDRFYLFFFFAAGTFSARSRFFFFARILSDRSHFQLASDHYPERSYFQFASACVSIDLIFSSHRLSFSSHGKKF